MRYGLKAATLVALLFATSPAAFAQNLSLGEAIEMALTRNTDLRITQKGEDKAEALLRQEKAGKRVKVSAGTTPRIGKNTDSARSLSMGLGFTATYNIYDGGKHNVNMESREIGVRSAVLTTQRQREKLKLDVTKAYYDAVAANETKTVRLETVNKYKAHLKQTSDLYGAGSKAKIDMIRADVELTNAEENLIKAANSYEIALTNLRNYINIDRNELLTLTDKFSLDPFNTQMSDCISAAFQNRKDLMTARYNLDQKELAVKAAKAAYQPTLDASVGVNPINATFEPNSSHNSGWDASLSAKWSVLDGGLIKAQVDNAIAERDEAKLNLEKQEEAVDLAVRQAYMNMREAEERLKTNRSNVTKAEEESYIEFEKYRAGAGTMLEVIDAEESLTRAKLNLILAESDYAKYCAEIENAMGIGLTDSEQMAARNMDMSVKETKVPAEEKIVRK